MVRALEAQGITKGGARQMVWHMLEVEEREQQPANSYDHGIGEEFLRLRREELPPMLDAVYANPTHFTNMRK